MIFLAAGFLASGCVSGGDASCSLRQEVNDRSIVSCVEGPDLDSEEFDELRDWCSTIAGRDNYVDGQFHAELCPRAKIAGGCDLGGGRRVWYYPNDHGYPTLREMDAICHGRGLTVVPPP